LAGFDRGFGAKRRICRDPWNPSFFMHTVWLAEDQIHFILPLDYQKECGAEGDRYTTPHAHFTLIPSLPSNI
jgi:hypothetical protein